MSRLNVANFRHPDGTADNINLDSSGRVLIGTSSASGDFGAVVNAGGTARVFLARGSLPSNAGGLGNLGWGRTNGEVGATIGGIADADWTSGSSYPTRLSFRTTASGASSTTEQMRLTSDGDLRFNSGYGSVATAYGVRAWVNFQGTGTVDRRANGNVSSIDDLGTGNYRINFSTSMPDDDYCVVGSIVGSTTGGYHSFVASSGDALSTSSCEIAIKNHDGTQYDLNVISVAVIR